MDSQLLFNFVLIIVAIFVVLYLVRIPKKLRRKKLYKSEFPTQWVEILQKNFALYSHLPEDLLRQLHGHINIFLHEKNFVGYKGIIIDDTIRVVIAAQACVLLLNRKTNYYPHLTNILIYPNAFNHAQQKSNQITGRLGESWHRGPIVLSWQHSHQGGANMHDGHNLIMHEFAHQLDQENGNSDGLPILQYNNIAQWSKILSKEFKTLKIKSKLKKNKFIDEYGATNPAEFFAVITEHFIEQPRQFKKKHPDLYLELQKYYQINPIEWV
ncbi:MAG: zinc-dependent peptidase [Proteobacteria bacterium]|nr:zinc-dependent peptidase [Pseudomonadota bacterium]